MRRLTFQMLGILEFAVAGVLIFIGLQLPSPQEISRGFDGADRATRHAGRQVRVLRQQVDDLRRPELQQLARRLQKETRTVTTALKSQRVDFDTVQTVRDSLGDVASGLDSMSKTLDPAAVPWRSIPMHDLDGEFFGAPTYWHLFASEWAWRPGRFDPLVRLVADWVVTNVMIVNPDCRWLLHPYDGGMDVIAESSAARDRRTRRWRRRSRKGGRPRRRPRWRISRSASRCSAHRHGRAG